MGVLVKMIDAVRVEQRRAALDAVHLIALLQEQFGKIGSVLPGYAGDERSLFGHRYVPVKKSCFNGA